MKKFLQVTIHAILVCLTSATFAQGIKGKIIDNDIKEGIVGATITIENSPYSTSTDLQGNYSIKLPRGEYRMSVSFSGYQKKTMTILVPATAMIVVPDIALEEAVEATEDEVLVLVGSRSTEGRAIGESTSPIDVISSAQLQTFGQMDLNQILHFLVPAFNANRQSGSDIADHVDPSSIRGLGPDQTLVLINGKRYHQSAVIGIFGTRGRGNTGTDLNTIPVAAIDHIEILRDGAAAQYGSDAIAGVINIVLKSSKKELTANINSGIYSKGDGFTANGNVNYGVKLLKDGFLNVTAEVLSKAKTFRPNDAQYQVDQQRALFGDASYKNSSLFLNAEVPLNSTTKVYSFGGISYRTTDAQGYGIDANSERNIKSIFPNGYEPRIGTSIFDGTLTVGLKTVISKWDMDFHNTYGVNTVDLSAINTLNPSQVIVNKVTQTTFNAGAYRFSQNTTGLNFTRSYGNILSGLNVAFGTEFRTDAYKIVAGEESSWKRYGTDVSLAGGAQNFPGVRPDNATNQSRTNLGIYTDFELSLTNKWLVAAALRYENYSDFGSTLNEKVASRYKVTDKFFVRGSFSTGFRAPSLAQRYFGATINDVVVDAEEGSGGYEERLIATNNSSITKALGIPSLKQETSFNSSIGFVVKPSKNLSISVDAYQVNVKDRIILTGEFYASDPIIKAAFDNLGVIGVQFFANALDTKTVGLDITANLITPLTKGTLTSSFGININDLSIQQIKTTPALAGRDSSFLTTRDKLLLVYSAPKYKFHALFDYKYERLMANVRFSGFSAVDVIDYDSQHPNTPNHYDAKIVTDLSLGYKLNQHTSILVGGNNLFNVYPNKQISSQTETGGMYEAIQMGFGGSFYSIRAKLNF